MPKLILSIIITCLLCIVRYERCDAQYRIPLDSVARFTFVSSAPFWNGPSYYKVEILPEDGKWKVYHLGSHTQAMNGDVVDTLRRYWRDMPQKDLSDLLKLISSTDTALHPKLFAPDKQKIYDLLDRSSTYSLFTAGQRAEFVRLINSKKKLNNMVTYVVRNSIAHQSDMSGYYIGITTKGNKNYEVTGYANREVPGHLPWTIGKMKSQDPRISFIFDKALHGDQYERFAGTRFYNDIALWLYIKHHLRERFTMQNLQKDAPVIYQKLSKHFSPEFMSSRPFVGRKMSAPLDSLLYTGRYRYARLPRYIN